MEIILNGKKRELADNATIMQCIGECGFPKGKIAVEVNGAIVPRSQHNTHILHSGDTVEVVTFVGGG